VPAGPLGAEALSGVYRFSGAWYNLFKENDYNLNNFYEVIINL